MPLLSPRETNRARGGARLQRRNRISAAGDMRRVGAWPDHHEVVPRNLPAINAIACCNKFLFGLRVMHQNQVGIVARRRLKRLPRSLRQDNEPTRAIVRAAMTSAAARAGWCFACGARCE